MSAFFVAAIQIKDPEKFQEYVSQTGATFALFGGELLTRGRADHALNGELDHQAVGIVKFPNMEALDNWYQSAEYQALIPLRDQAASVTLVAYNEPPA